MSGDVPFYVAAPYHMRLEAKAFAELITERWGYTCTAVWLQGGEETPNTPASHWARVDLEDIDKCDWFIVLTEVESKSSGHQVETGYALGMNKNVSVVGPKTNIFHSLSSVGHYANLNEFKSHWDL